MFFGRRTFTSGPACSFARSAAGTRVTAATCAPTRSSGANLRATAMLSAGARAAAATFRSDEAFGLRAN